MEKKEKRLEAIKNIIASGAIYNQSDLLKPLLAAGYHVTQATLSRDLKELKIAKVPGNDDRYVYALPKADSLEKSQRKDRAGSTGHGSMGGFVSIDFSKNLAVIKTTPGNAGSIAYDIDSVHNKEILGTLAGDDTVLVVLREDVTHDRAYNVLAEYIPALKTK